MFEQGKHDAHCRSIENKYSFPLFRNSCRGFSSKDFPRENDTFPVQSMLLTAQVVRHWHSVPRFRDKIALTDVQFQDAMPVVHRCAVLYMLPMSRHLQ